MKRGNDGLTRNLLVNDKLFIPVDKPVVNVLLNKYNKIHLVQHTRNMKMHHSDLSTKITQIFYWAVKNEDVVVVWVIV